MKMINMDIAIVGGGMVGLTLAAALKSSNLRIAIIEGNAPDSRFNILPDLRVSALNRAGENILKNIGAWNGVLSRRYSPYQKIIVWEQDSFASIEFDAIDLGQPNLGHIVENRVIQLSLFDKVKHQHNVTIFCPDKCASIMFSETKAWLTLDSGRVLTTKLVVGADGANSWVRTQLSIPLTHWDYGHSALVANIRTTQHHAGIARQIFTPDGPLAFLPLSDPHLCAIVWSQSPKLADLNCTMPSKSFNKALSVAFDFRLGFCSVEGERAVFPLKMRYARDFILDRVALIGDAAHTIHPLAGQGLNLGLLDATSLAQELIYLQEEGKDIGEKSKLRHFERWRKAEATQMIAVMQGLRDLFAGKNPTKKLIRGIGLMAAATLPGIKTQFIKRALGLSGDLPAFAKK
ncbi:FAD-dependent 2-octaprenylphenol hydroxylase [Candidatus Enterovibrio altilux]|uniref:2-octaprenyl-3-methyl-6-methoxy-1,4-benzoquinol hydroxylase n=1 Tax=Candidatus Enterovibrio altilux TaxID=1927128 RepID=A0A291B723_9GAMM|nr:FAD-dependent 2-octaprenylphenol hydroxylase [Candidatus Enterovibrio luxaltus]ATF08798.1 2-octaprenyl-3-methyl-6-methoxy-1,4-benzoquinol hydroxylase [Candidatus Enterovibrio luxaltus]